MPRKKRERRSVESYLQSAKSLSQFAPSLKKYAKRKRLKPHEKAAISRKENYLRYTDRLVPVDAKQARLLKEYLYEPERPVYARDSQGKIIKDKHTGQRIIERMEPVKGSGIRAMRLLGTGNDLKSIKARKKKQRTASVYSISKELTLETNGRNWLYQGIPQAKRMRSARSHARQLAQIAKPIFDSPKEALPIERIAELAKRAFKRPRVKQIHLWTRHGRVGRGFVDFDAFLDWLQEQFVKYRQTDAWVNGIAIELT